MVGSGAFNWRFMGIQLEVLLGRYHLVQNLIDLWKRGTVQGIKLRHANSHQKVIWTQARKRVLLILSQYPSIDRQVFPVRAEWTCGSPLLVLVVGGWCWRPVRWWLEIGHLVFSMVRTGPESRRSCQRPQNLDSSTGPGSTHVYTTTTHQVVLQGCKFTYVSCGTTPLFVGANVGTTMNSGMPGMWYLPEGHFRSEHGHGWVGRVLNAWHSRTCIVIVIYILHVHIRSCGW